MEFKDFLVWILNSGGAVIVMSWLCERWVWFQAKASDTKQMIFFILSAVLALSAYVILNYVPAAALSAVAPFWSILQGLFVTIFLGQMFHKASKR